MKNQILKEMSFEERVQDLYYTALAKGWKALALEFNPEAGRLSMYRYVNFKNYPTKAEVRKFLKKAVEIGKSEFNYITGRLITVKDSPEWNVYHI